MAIFAQTFNRLPVCPFFWTALLEIVGLTIGALCLVCVALFFWFRHTRPLVIKDDKFDDALGRAEEWGLGMPKTDAYSMRSTFSRG